MESSQPSGEALGGSWLQWTASVRGCPQRVNHAAARLGPHVYSFGGYSSSRSARLWHGSRIDVLQLTVHSLRWRDVTDSVDCPLVDGHQQPSGRYGHSAVAHRGTALVFGGRNDDSVAPPDIWQFCTQPLRWRRRQATGNTPLGRDGHSACVLRHAMIVFGGFTNSDEYDDQVYSCDLELWQWTRVSACNEAPSARDFCCSAAWGDGGLFVWGGRSDEAGVVHSGHSRYDAEVHHFDVGSRRWSRAAVGPLPVGRRSGVMFRLLDSLYFGFGYNEEAGDDGHLGDLWRLDVASGRVAPALPGQRLSVGPCPRRRLAAVVLGRSRVLLFGGTCAAYSFTPPVEPSAYCRLYAPLLPRLPAFRHPDGAPAAAVAVAEAEALAEAEAAAASEASHAGGQTGPAHRDDFLRELEEPENSSLGLKDIADMFLLEAQPTLQTLCILQVVRHRLPLHSLHALLQEDVLSRISDNCISPVT